MKKSKKPKVGKPKEKEGAVVASVEKFIDQDMIKLAKDECANWHNRNCLSSYACKLLAGDQCGYFEKYVKPLLLLKKPK